MKRVHILVSGWVQGVLFRQNARNLAQKLRIVGWVRNTPDGKVEIVAEGEKEKLDELISWCHKGPSLAHVDEVDVQWENTLGDFDEFEII